jgi:RHS repeat-associated protein
MRKRFILPGIVALLSCFAGPGQALADGLDVTFYNMGAATETQVRSDASNNLRTQFSSQPVSVPSYVNFEGYFTPDSSNTEVAIFSDDGVDLYVDDVRVLARKGQGQHLPDLSQSFRVIDFNWAAGRSYKIKIEYFNGWYYPDLGDIDGCTMYAYNGGGTISAWRADIDTDSNNDGLINDSDESVEETSPGRYVNHNVDDDNSNSTQDKDESGTVTGEDDLALVNLAYEPTTGINGAKVVLDASSGGTRIKVWASSTKGTQITLPKTYIIGTDTVPANVYVEGVETGEAMLDMVMRRSDDTEVCRDKVKFTVRNNTPPTFTDIVAVHAAAKCSDQVTITFTTSETLSGNPTVTVNGNAVSNLSHTGNDYTCTYTIGYYDEVGEATIYISGYDLDSNLGEVTDIQALWIVDCTTGGNCSGLGGFTYDKNGNRRTMCDSRGLTVYFYDVMGRLVKVVEPDEKWIAYEYDDNGNRTKMTTHSDGTPSFHHVTEYSYYDNGLLYQVTDQLDGVTTYTYKDNGLVDTITYPNSTKAVHTYNSRNWLTCISNRKSDDTIIAQFDYTYDETYWGKNGTRTRVIENILKPDGNRISAQVDYEYDNLYRLVHEHRIAYNGGDPGVAYEYNFAYDDAGNRTSWQVVGGTTTNYTYDAANKMTSPGTFTYDDKGNTLTQVVGGVTTTYTWDYLNRLTQWQKTGETTQAYVYNADGMRVRVTPSGGTATDFLLDDREIAEEIMGANFASYVGLGYSLLSKVSGATRNAYHADGIGSTRTMTDDNVDVGTAVVYDAYGNLAQCYPVDGTPEFGYAGQYRYYTDSTGLDYLKARYYDSQTGRFISKDPIGYAGGINLYEYVAGMPTVAVDPYGTSILGELPGAWADVYGGQAGNNYAWCVFKCGLNYALGFIPLPIDIDFGPGFSKPSIGFNPPALIGIPGSPIFQFPVGRPPGNWVINPGYWGRVRPGIPGIGRVTPGPSGWRNARKYLGPIWQIINLGQELGCLRNCLKNYKCENGGVW